MDPGTSHLERLEAAQRQLLVFAGEINHLHQAERARAAELERAMERLRGSYLDMMKTLAADEQLRYGFLPHDVGKVGLPEGRCSTSRAPWTRGSGRSCGPTRCPGSRWWPAASRWAAPSR